MTTKAKTYGFHVYKDTRGEWRWRLTARNGRIVADSGEGYRNRGNALRAIAATRAIAAKAIVLP